ncbi:MAG TPA: hypothetical protein G4O00_09705 [Thermoflexia bacterium]|jgi:hypothetical protein|nr:hypothetical protein [Thermoflexia bacterium]
MKKYIPLVMIILLLTLPVAVNADAPAPEGPFNTAFRIQNLGTQDANCVFSFYDANGNEVYSSGALSPIPAGESAYIYVPSDTTVADGQYAGVVSCDQEVAAVVNFSDPDSGASYSGISGSEVATTLYAPGIYDNYYNYYSNVIVQNASGSTIDITLEIYEPGNSTPVYTDTRTNVPANGFVVFEQEGLAQLADNKFYSAKIIGTGNIAAVVNIYGRGPYDDQLYSYNPFSSGSTVAYAPVIMNNYYGYNTALVIQNMGTADANVKITYSDGTVKYTTIPPGAADSRYTPLEGLATGLLTGAKIESTNGQPLAVLVNESTDKNRAASYSGFTSGSTTVRAPIVMRRYYKYNTSITCQNIGTASATMSISYGGISGTTTSPSIPVNGIHLFYQPADSLLSDGFIGSATITSTQPIVCVVNEDMNEAPERDQIMDQLYAYNGIGQ